MTVEVSIKADIKKAEAMLAKVGRDLDKKEYLKLIGQSLLYWINRNFKEAGTEHKWKPLSPNTIASKHSSAPLQDTGALRQSFVSKVRGSSAHVGSESKKAIWHHEGTRPYDIYPVRKKTLKFLTTQGPVFSKHVHHPGLPKRPLIPSEITGKKIAVRELENYVNVLVQEANK